MIYINCPPRKLLSLLFQCDSFIIKMHRWGRRKSEFMLRVYSTLRANYYYNSVSDLVSPDNFVFPVASYVYRPRVSVIITSQMSVLRLLYRQKLIFTSQLGLSAHDYFTLCYSRKHCRNLTIQSFRRSLNDITITLI